MFDFEALCLIVKANPGSTLSHNKEGFHITGNAKATFAIPKEVKAEYGPVVLSNPTRFKIHSNNTVICTVSLE